MTNLSRLNVIRVSAFSMLLDPPCNLLGAERARQFSRQIAKTYGLDSWDQIEAIRYTWNCNYRPLRMSPVRGSGSPRPARSPTKERIKTASRSRLPTSAPSSAASPTP